MGKGEERMYNLRLLKEIMWDNVGKVEERIKSIEWDQKQKKKKKEIFQY
jgi:hypothetical protein